MGDDGVDLSTAARLLSVPEAAGTKTQVCARSTVRPEAEPNDEVLIGRIRPGDEEATTLLFRRYAQLVRVVSLRILHDEAEADDLVQDLFLFLHKNAAIYDNSKSTPRSWLVQMTYRKAISRRRYLAARGHYKNAELDRCVAGFTAAATPAYDSSIEALFGKEGLKKVMGELTAEQHETLRLHFYEGYTLAEISRKLGQSLGNVRHHYYRGLGKLRKQMHESKLQNC